MSSHLSDLSQRAAALAALTQAVYLVDSVARKGIVDSEDFRLMMASLFGDPHGNVLGLYGVPDGLHTGIRICKQLLTASDLPQARPLMVYSGGLITLERRLARNDTVRQTLAAGMKRIHGQQQYFGDAMHANIIAAIADLYGETISNMKPRIIVRGKAEHLSQSANTQRVRALLMAGLRAAHLWHNHGGGHITLLLRRRTIVRELEKLESLR